MVNGGSPAPIGSAGSGIGGMSNPDMQQPGHRRALGMPSGSVGGAQLNQLDIMGNLPPSSGGGNHFHSRNYSI